MPEPIYRLRIGDQTAPLAQFGDTDALVERGMEPAVSESPEPVDHPGVAGDSPEAAARAQVHADERSTDAHDNLLREDAPRE